MVALLDEDDADALSLETGEAEGEADGDADVTLADGLGAAVVDGEALLVALDVELSGAGTAESGGPCDERLNATAAASTAAKMAPV